MVSFLYFVYRRIFMKYVLLVLFVLLIFGCGNVKDVQEEVQELVDGEEEQSVEELCVALCEAYLGDKSNGPCLGLIKEDWVCDIAHSPRLDVDNLPENQCEEYRSGSAKHFVEVSETCNVIRKY